MASNSSTPPTSTLTISHDESLETSSNNTSSPSSNNFTPLSSPTSRSTCENPVPIEAIPLTMYSGDCDTNLINHLRDPFSPIEIEVCSNHVPVPMDSDLDLKSTESTMHRGLHVPMDSDLDLKSTESTMHRGLNVPMDSDLHLKSTESTMHMGRPIGLNNYPIGTRANFDPDHGLFPTLTMLEIPSGYDIIEFVQNYARAQNAVVTILNGTGRVKNVMVEVSWPDNFSFHYGAHDLLNINGVEVGPIGPNHSMAHSRLNGPNSFSNGIQSYLKVTLNGPNVGRWGGHVVGRLMTASPVTLEVLTFRLVHMDPTNVASTSGAGPSQAGPSSSPGSSSSGTNRDSDLADRKRQRFSDF